MKRAQKGLKMIRLFFILSVAVTLLPLPVKAAPGYDQVASSTAKSKPIRKYGMTPISGEYVQDGSYVVDTDCSSSFFRILEATLTVKDGQMSAVLDMSSNSYLYVYPGTAEEAAAADMEDYIPLEKGEAESSFTVPVKALNMELDCAAFSKKKEKWYDRKIIFDASSLPQEAIPFALPDYGLIEDAVELYDDANGTDTLAQASGETTEADTKKQEAVNAVTMEENDGEYSIDVSLSGGSGRASVTSPTWLYIRDSKAYVKLLWSSSYYDYMIVGGQTYTNETTDGSNSTFTIPVTALDEPMQVIADTTSMGEPLEIEYTLTFYSDTVAGTGQIPQEAAKKVLVIALVIIIVGGVLNYLVKKRKYH